MKFFNILTAVLLIWSCKLQAQTPVASYDFTSNAKDGSTFANHAVVHGAKLTQDRFGFGNRAFRFDGEQSNLIIESQAQLRSEYVSIAFWVNPNSLPAQGEVFLVSHGGWQERYKISLPGHGKPVFTTNYSNGISDMDSGDGNALVPGTWTHVVFVHDGSKDIIYMNGVKANEKDVVGTLNFTDYPMGIGFNAVDGGGFFDGSIDDVRVFDVALDDAAIAALYQAESTRPTVGQGVVAQYQFSNNAKDNSEYHNDLLSKDITYTTDRFGYGSSAAYFNGESSVATASASPQINGAATTISMWVNVASLPANGEAFLLSNGGWQERIKISLPTHGKPVFTTNSTGGISDMDSGDSHVLVPNKWTLLTFVHDGTNDKIYFDGVLAAQKAVSGDLNETSFPLGIGYNAVDGGNYFHGAIDDVTIFNFGFSDQEVMDYYQQSIDDTNVPKGLVASYPLDGNNYADISGFSNDLHIASDDVTVQNNRWNWANNAVEGSFTADNSAALQSPYTTISFWAKPDALPASGEAFLLSHGGWQERWKISLPSHGKPVFTTHAATCCSDMDSGDGNALVVGEWTHVAMVHDGVNDYIYINGELANQKASAGELAKTRYPLGIGFDPIDNANPFDGSIDDVMIFDYGMSAAEVKGLYDFQSPAPAVLEELVANYTFNNNGFDDTQFGNHIKGNVQLVNDRFGKSNRAMTSTNGRGVQASNSAQLQTDYTSIAFWANANSLPASGEVYLLSHGGWQERWKISLPSHGKPVFTTHTTSCCNDVDAGDGNTVAVGEWRHFVMIHDGTTDKIYMNGHLVNEKAYAGALNSTTSPLGIGYDPIDNGGHFDGSLDEVRIYNYALSDSDVLALYNEQSQEVPDVDTEAPCAPLDLSASVSFTTVDLTWSGAEDNVAVTSYNVYQDGWLVGNTKNTYMTISDLTPLTQFNFAVTALDEASNESLPTTLLVTSGQDETPDTTPPTKPGNLAGNAGANSVLLSWEASVDDRQLSGYVVLVDGVYFDSLGAASTSIFVGGLDSETAYTFEVYAYDLSGNNSEIAEITLSTTKPLDTGEPGLVAHYKFDGDANDATPYNNHGAEGGNVKYETSNHSGAQGGLHAFFDGDRDSILVPNAVHLVSDFTTVSFWIKVEAQNTAIAESYVIDFGHWDQRWKISLPQHLKIVWTTNGNNVQFSNFISDMDSGDGNEIVKGFWWYVTMVHDGVNDLIYVNGELANSKPVPTKLNSTNRSLCFAANPVEGGQYFNGGLDNVKIYNKALTADEIRKLFEQGTTGLTDYAVEKFGNVKLMPNPIVETLNISHQFHTAKNVSIRILDQVGRQWNATQLTKDQIQSGEVTLQKLTLPTGSYFANFIVDGQNVGSLPFIKN